MATYIHETGKKQYGVTVENYIANKERLHNALKGLDATVTIQTKKGSIQTLQQVLQARGNRDLVIYTVSEDTLVEEHYISDGVTMSQGNIQPILNARLMNPDGKTLKKNIIDSIKSSILLNEDYQYKWVNNTILCVNNQNEPVNIDTVDNDDFYTLKLLELLMKKGLHTGVLLLHSETLNVKVQNNIKAIIKLLCDDYTMIDIS